jgi:Fe-S-cluster-containing dehydrogenase component/formate-dependent nitrite reductase membrane component NrfD
LKYGFVLDQRKCIGCHACTVACKSENGVPLGAFRTWVKYIEKGEFPNTRRYFAVLRCNHCDNAPCVTICPTVALFKRPDGIVDFDNARCIGCKSCMQACPYDALYIDPESHTAAKCHYCAHRIETGLQPACVVVCPEQAIIAGDLDNPLSEISRLVSREQVSVRKPEQGTQPKVYYLGADDAALTPGVASRSGGYMWAERPIEGETELSLSKPLFSMNGGATKTAGPAEPPEAKLDEPKRARLSRIREVYDVYHAQPWGRRVSGYLWTKSIAAGVVLVAALAGLLGPAGGRTLNLAAPFIGLLFLAITSGLLVLDLKRPDRFHYVLLKPNLRSWLVLGTYALIAFGAFTALWLLGGLLNAGWVGLIRWPAALLAVAAAGYSAFLFGQAEGRDSWQSPLLLPQLIAAAVVAGSASLLLIASFTPAGNTLSPSPFAILLWLGLAAMGIVLLAELYTPHASSDVARSAKLLTNGVLSPIFWGGAVFIGLFVPLVLLFVSRGTPGPLAALAGIAALAGLLVYEDLWVQAGQSTPLS